MNLPLKSLLLLLLVSLSLAHAFDPNSNDLGLSEDAPAPASPSLSTRKYKYDPSIFDILSNDYFDNDAPPAPTSPPNTNPMKDVEVEEPLVVTSTPYCLGCPTQVPTTSDKIQSLALFAFNSHLQSLQDLDTALRMVRVTKAQTQVVAGQKYILDLEVGVTNCTKAQHDQDPLSCQIVPQEDTFICNFEVVEQSWANHKEVVRSNCKKENTQSDDIDGDADADAETADGGVDVDIAPQSDDIGSEPVVDLKDLEVDVDVDSDEDEGDVDAELEKTTLEPLPQPLSRRRRDTKKVLGGPREAEESQDKLMELARFAVRQLDAIDADDDARLVVEILESKKQTVSGWLYTLKLRVAQTTCPESETEVATLEKCKDKILPPYRICQVKILVQPWQETSAQQKVTESQCYPEKYKKGKKMSKALFHDKQKEENDSKSKYSKSKVLVGGYSDVDITSKDLQELANFVVESIDMQSNALHAQKLVKIVQAQRQIVGGVKTKFVVELGYTACRKKPKLDKSQCAIDEKRDHQFCTVEVWEQPWLKSKQITHTKCGPKQEDQPQSQTPRDKRSLKPHLLGGDGLENFSHEDHKTFKTFLVKYGKEYESKEYLHRLGVFKENMRKVKLLQDSEQGTAEYGATVFADLTEEEFAKHHLGLRPDLRQNSRLSKPAKIPVVPASSIPSEFDWRNYGAVTPVKNQGMCGSCWAFSVTGNIEGLYAKKHSKLLSFSEQELVDCDTLDSGCNGGLPENAYKAIQKLGGLEEEAAYPYDGHNDKCSFNPSKASAKVKGFVELPKNETDMAIWLVKNGPISIGINANAMQFYFGGVSHPWKFLCSKKSLDHGVLIVGYGVHTTSIRHKTLPYWIVKNSWGPTWGEKGYYRVYRGDNTCGISEMASSAVVE